MPQSVLPTQWQPVASSNLSRVRYWAADRLLDIEFLGKGGRPPTRYRYIGVPKAVYEGLLAAGSKGKYHHAHIRNTYPYTKL